MGGRPSSWPSRKQLSTVSGVLEVPPPTAVALITSWHWDVYLPRLTLSTPHTCREHHLLDTQALVSVSLLLLFLLIFRGYLCILDMTSLSVILLQLYSPTRWSYSLFSPTVFFKKIIIFGCAGLPCCVGFSLGAESGGALQLWCSGLSLWWLLLLWFLGSRARTP